MPLRAVGNCARALTYIRQSPQLLLHSSPRREVHDTLVFVRNDDMKAIVDLFSTDYGLMSIIGIIMMIVGMGWAYGALKSKMAESEKAARR